MTDLLLARRLRRGPSEVLLNINLEAVWRLGGNLELRGSEVVAKRGQESGVKRADAFFGGDWWRWRFLEARSGQAVSAAEAARSVVDEYRRRVERQTGRRSMSIEIRRRPGHNPLFLLTLFFEHDYAGYKFADAACRATRKWRDAYRRKELEDFLNASPQDALLDDQVEVQKEEARRGNRQEETLDSEWIQAICQNIRGSWKSDLPVSSEIRFILGDTLGLAGERHIRKAWDLLADEKYLEPRPKGKDLYRATMRRI